MRLFSTLARELALWGWRRRCARHPRFALSTVLDAASYDEEGERPRQAAVLYYSRRRPLWRRR